MKTYEFSIIASGLDPHAEDFENRFYGARCDDATVSFQKGHIILDFAREADSADAAYASAIEDVMLAGATVDRIEPDPLVSLSDIASRTGMTRSAMTQYSKGQRGKGVPFPIPVARVTSESPLWDWATVAKWLFLQRKISRDAAVEAELVKTANEGIESHDTRMRERLQERRQTYERELEAA